MLARMEEIRTDIISRAAAALQRNIRRYNEQSVFLQLREAALVVQKSSLFSFFIIEFLSISSNYTVSSLISKITRQFLSFCSFLEFFFQTIQISQNSFLDVSLSL